MPIPERKKYTIDEFYAMDLPECCELIDGDIYIGESEEPYDPNTGEIIDMSPAPNIFHQKIVTKISYLIGDYILKHKGKCEVFSAPTDVKISSEENVQPDIFVACDPNKIDGQRHNGAPDWVIEILSPSTSKRDAVDKLYLYRDNGVREYWIIDPMKRRVIVYPFAGNATVEMYTFESSITVHIYKDAPEPLVIRLADYL